MKHIQTTLIAMALTLSGSMYTNAQILHEESAEQFVMKKMQGIIESQKKHKNILLVDQSDALARKRNELIEQAAFAAGSVTASIVLYNVMETPASVGDVVWASLKFLLGVWIVGGVLSKAYEPVIRFFIGAIYHFIDDPIIEQQQSWHKDALTEFIRNWHEFKPHTPVSLHQKFDELYLLYLEQGAELALTEDQAAYLINGIIMNCIQEHLRVSCPEVA